MWGKGRGSAKAAPTHSPADPHKGNHSASCVLGFLLCGFLRCCLFMSGMGLPTVPRNHFLGAHFLGRTLHPPPPPPPKIHLRAREAEGRHCGLNHSGNTQRALGGRVFGAPPPGRFGAEWQGMDATPADFRCLFHQKSAVLRSCATLLGIEGAFARAATGVTGKFSVAMLLVAMQSEGNGGRNWQCGGGTTPPSTAALKSCPVVASEEVARVRCRAIVRDRPLPWKGSGQPPCIHAPHRPPFTASQNPGTDADLEWCPQPLINASPTWFCSIWEPMI